ncbi:MAG: hypothetical protein QJR03_09985 [Sphaerobacter sp.]|nr:hypothetical protein [Sphaerobacter sp.]
MHDPTRVRAGPAREDSTVLPPAFHDLIERRVTELLTQSGQEGSLTEEISALRLVLARVLAEEENPVRLAASIPRIVDAVVRAVRTQRTLAAETAAGLTEAVTQVLLELGLGGEP